MSKTEGNKNKLLSAMMNELVQHRRDRRLFVTSVEKQLKTKDKVIPRLSFILPTANCNWFRVSGGCVMCTLGRYSSSIPPSLLVKQFQTEFQKYSYIKKEMAIDLYTNGSFLDEREVSSQAGYQILEFLTKDNRVNEISIESRPEFITRTKLHNLKKFTGDVEITIMIGLESWSDFVRKFCINKGFTIDSFKKTSRVVKEYFHLGVYLLLKPPFLNEIEALEDIKKSIAKLTNLQPKYIIVMPNNVQRSTITYLLWKLAMYRPPWLWTILELLRTNSINKLRVGGFSFYPRPIDGPRNCGKCDRKIMKAIRDYNLGNKIRTYACPCLQEWKKEILKKEPPLKERLIRSYGLLVDHLGVPECYLDSTIQEIEHCPHE